MTSLAQNQPINLASVIPVPGADAVDGTFSLADFLQLACMASRSANLLVRQGPRIVGEVFIEEGKLWSVRDRHGTGEAALNRIMFAPGCEIEATHIYEGRLPSRDVMRNWQHVLLDVARIHDESVATESQTGVRKKVRRPPPVPEVASSPQPASLRVQIRYEADWALTGLQLRVDGISQSLALLHELVMLVPDEWAGKSRRIELEGMRAGQPFAHGQVSVSAVAGKEVQATLTLKPLQVKPPPIPIDALITEVADEPFAPDMSGAGVAGFAYLYDAAIDAMLEGERSTAYQMLEQALRLCPGHPRAQQTLARLEKEGADVVDSLEEG